MNIYLLLLLLLCNDFLLATQMTITQSGLYVLGQDIAYDPDLTPDDAIILISASNVILDLNNHMLSQAGSTIGLRGVEVSSALSNVIIQNGVIDTVSGPGVLVNPTCTNIRVRDLQFIRCNDRGIKIQSGCQGINVNSVRIANCPSGGIFANGTPSARIQLLRVENSTVVSCTGNQGDAAKGIELNSVTIGLLDDCTIGANDALLTSSGYGLVLTDCRSMGINDCLFSANGGFQEGAGVWVQTSTQCFFRNCIFNLNLSRSSNSNAFAAGALVDYSNQCRFINCEMSGNTNPFARGHGIRLFQGSRNVIQNCILEGNTGGIRAFGAEFINEVKSECIDSFLRNNTSTNAWGIRLTGTCTNCYIHNNQCISNNGATTSFGVQDLLDISTSAITSNRAFDHIMNYTVSYPVGITLPRVIGSLSNIGIGLPSITGGLLDNVDIQP